MTSNQKSESLSQRSTGEVISWSILAAVVEWFIFPFAGVAIGLILAVTRLRSNPAPGRWIPALVGAVVLILHVIGLQASSGGSAVGS